MKDGVIDEIGNSNFKNTENCDVIIDADGATITPGFIDSHVHITFGDYTPRQNTIGYLSSYLHGGTTTQLLLQKFMFQDVQMTLRVLKHWP